jgi:hypothetical protein
MPPTVAKERFLNFFGSNLVSFEDVLHPIRTPEETLDPSHDDTE